jgi:hypothetical protein
MALEAEGAHSGKVALSAALDHGQNVIGIPEIAMGHKLRVRC